MGFKKKKKDRKKTEIRERVENVPEVARNVLECLKSTLLPHPLDSSSIEPARDFGARLWTSLPGIAAIALCIKRSCDCEISSTCNYALML